MKELESVWVTGELLGELASPLAEFCNEEGYAEVAMVMRRSARRSSRRTRRRSTRHWNTFWCRRPF